MLFCDSFKVVPVVSKASDDYATDIQSAGDFVAAEEGESGVEGSDIKFVLDS